MDTINNNPDSHSTALEVYNPDIHADFAGMFPDGFEIEPQIDQRLRTMYLGYLAATLELHEVKDNLELVSEKAEKADYDDLTGLLTRKSFFDRLEKKLQVAATGEVAIIFVDLSDFKMINDKNGHEAGDYALKLVADVLISSTRVDEGLDIVCRYGGDEFLIAVSSNEHILNTVYKIRTRIHTGLSEESRRRQLPFEVTAATGFALHERDKEISETIAVADDKMYRNKESRKRNRSNTVD